MVWWIIAAVVALGLAVLVFAAVRLLGTLRGLRSLQRKLLLRVEQAAQLQEPALALQRRAESMQTQLVEMQTRLEARAARRTPGG